MLERLEVKTRAGGDERHGIMKLVAHSDGPRETGRGAQRTGARRVGR